ncbi:hypothetical protein CDIK_2508 [Cucumispora dikerogammari]|nr:hypothetical protein CDIK_2508 [Cucumispora dikerogammari]
MKQPIDLLDTIVANLLNNTRVINKGFNDNIVPFDNSKNTLSEYSDEITNTVSESINEELSRIYESINNNNSDGLYFQSLLLLLHKQLIIVYKTGILSSLMFLLVLISLLILLTLCTPNTKMFTCWRD